MFKKEQLNHFIQNEIHALKSLNKSTNDLKRAADIISKSNGKVVISGIGKSGYIGMKVSATFTSLGISSIFLNPVEAFHGDLASIGKDDVLVAISNGGETKETVKLAHHLQKHNVKIISIIGKKNSTLYKISDCSIVFNIKSEGSPFNLAPMASTTVSLVIGDFLACIISLNRGFTEKDFSNFHPGGSLGLKLSKVAEFMRTDKAVPIIKDTDKIYLSLKEINNKMLGVTGIVNKNNMITGVITDGDIRRFLSSGKFSYEAKVSAIMTKNPKIISKDSSLQEAITIMEKYKITSLFVVNKQKAPIGIITMHDIIENKLNY